MTEAVGERTTGGRRRWVWAAAGVLAATALGVWQLRTPAPPPPLDPGWTGIAQVLAGDGTLGSRDGDAAGARFMEPFGIAADADGTLYIADAGEAPAIRVLTRDGRVSTLAGGTTGYADGTGAAARFDTPSAIALEPQGTLVVADTGNNAIRRVTRGGQVTTVAGDGTAGDRDGPGAGARFNGPVGIAVDRTGRIVVSDTYNDRLRVIDTSGNVTTLSLALETDTATGAEDPGLNTPCGVAIDRHGTILVADTGNGRIAAVDASGRLTTPAWAFEDALVRPIGITAAPTGEVFVTDDRGRITGIAADGTTRLVAGGSAGFRDGAGREARFRRPSGIAVLAAGRLAVADAGNALIRALSAPQANELRLPPAPGIAPRFDVTRFGAGPLLWPIAPMDGPFEIAGTLGEARGAEGSERFHAGVDVRVDEGTTVVAVRPGRVASPVSSGELGTLNEWLRIGALTYVHVRAGRTRTGGIFDDPRFVPRYDAAGTLTAMRVKRGAVFAAGEAIATVNPFNHVHLNVGWPGEEQNPLRFRLTHFADTIAPTITPAGIRFYDDAGQAFPGRRGTVTLSGRVHIVVDAWDRADDNRPNRRLGVYALGYQVLHADGTPVDGFAAPLETLTFDELAPDPQAAGLVYAPGSGIPFYGRRVTRFLYSVTNTFRGGHAAAGAWDTTALPDGNYIVRVFAWDAMRNGSRRDVRVAVAQAR